MQEGEKQHETRNMVHLLRAIYLNIIKNVVKHPPEEDYCLILCYNCEFGKVLKLKTC